MPGGNPRTTLFHGPFPPRIANGRDAMLTNVDGFAHLNFLGDYTAGVLGHSHPVIRKAIGRALDAGMSFGAQNAYEPEFARLVVTTRGPLLGPRITEAGT
jgi:glutamate-1-semialdehyde 2,1-aminomutase